MARLGMGVPPTAETAPVQSDAAPTTERENPTLGEIRCLDTETVLSRISIRQRCTTTRTTRYPGASWARELRSPRRRTLAYPSSSRTAGADVTEADER